MIIFRPLVNLKIALPDEMYFNPCCAHTSEIPYLKLKPLGNDLAAMQCGCHIKRVQFQLIFYVIMKSLLKVLFYCFILLQNIFGIIHLFGPQLYVLQNRVGIITTCSFLLLT